ncbi:MAG: hypothetical protein Q7K39_02485 [Candidatus Magasanikbacteria bacterium]|nr:hypothetical protein [Candidatus Magasanikbacteria bacterium]
MVEGSNPSWPASKYVVLLTGEEKKKMEKNPFFHSFIKPIEQPKQPHTYLGIGCVGSDGEPGEFGFALALFLWFAEQMRRSLEVPSGTILINNIINGRPVDMARKERLLKKLLDMLEMPWEIVRVSDLFGSLWEGVPYEQIETASTLTLLPNGGYQIGWVYPYETSGGKDERYFSRYLLQSSGRRDIGFVFGEFPTLLQTGIHGPPYLVKPSHALRRILLIEDSVRRKFALPSGDLPRMRPGKTIAVLRVLEVMGVVKSFDERSSRFFKENRHVEMLVDGMERLSHVLRQKVYRHFPDSEV